MVFLMAGPCDSNMASLRDCTSTLERVMLTLHNNSVDVTCIRFGIPECQEADNRGHNQAPW